MSKKQIITLILILLITPIGFYTKFYHGTGEQWIHNYLGGILYVIFWILIYYLFFPKEKPWIISITVFIVTCAVEFLQLWHQPVLELLRSNFIGRTILGNSFTLYDFPWYLTGAVAGYLILTLIQKK
jgi:hypothetical protein